MSMFFDLLCFLSLSDLTKFDPVGFTLYFLVLLWRPFLFRAWGSLLISFSAKVICTYYSFKTSILAKEERAIQIELNDYHDFKEFSVFLKQRIFSCNITHISCIVKSYNRCPNQNHEMNKTKKSSKNSFYRSDFYNRPSYSCQQRPYGQNEICNPVEPQC